MESRGAPVGQLGLQPGPQVRVGAGELQLVDHGPDVEPGPADQQRDPAAARDILPSNGRRIVRALEVMELTGRPFAATLPAPAERYDTVLIGLDRDDLDERVDARVDRMWTAGLVAEVRALEAAGLRDGPTASRALGYQQVLALGDTDEAGQETKRATRRFVRRQRSWFRRDPRIIWLDGADPALAEHARTLVR